MAARGSFFVLNPAPAGSSADGCAVSVPGNADELVERATDLGLQLTKVSDNSVVVALPTGASAVGFIELLSQLSFVFGAPAEDELGWLTVKAKGILGMADATDADLAPDYVPVVGTVVLTPTLGGPIRLESTDRFFAVSSVSATFDSDGELFYAGQKNVRLIAPQWTELSNRDWKWVANVQPGFGQGWQGFTVEFTGAPGDIVHLGSLL